MNEYEREFRQVLGGKNRWDHFEEYRNQRSRLRQKYGFSIPTDDVISQLVKYGPFVEMFAGIAYWAYLFEAYGVHTLAYDHAPAGSGKSNGLAINWVHSWYPVIESGIEVLADHKERTLLMGWPMRDDTAERAIDLYQGDTLVYVGEHEYGCCAPDDFFEKLEREWTPLEKFSIPTFEDVHDYVSVWRRT